MTARVRVAPAWDLAAVAATKACAGLVVLGAGFVALSDDDFSRTVIAERFAGAPSFDPSGTSWLPLPFWISGATLGVFGRTLAVARAVAVMEGIASALLVHRAARWIGVPRLLAVVAAIVVTTVPTALWLGVSFQPEALTAGLVVLGAVAGRESGSRRLVGGAALGAACLCRYEAWPAAVAFAALCFADARHGPPPAERRVLVLSAAAALAAPVAWMIHGVVTHGDALFFVHRVAAYRRALGEQESRTRSLIAYPLALIRAEPEITLGSAAALWWSAHRNSKVIGAIARPAMIVECVFLFLVVGRLLDGAPTHHDERTLLPIWTLLAIAAARALASGAPERKSSERAAPGHATSLLIALFVVAVSVAVRVTNPPLLTSERAAERAIGNEARRALPADACLVIDTPDYGYFAVIAAFGAPERADPFDRHDPREPRSPDAFVSPDALVKSLAEHHADWFVASRAHAEIAELVGQGVANAGDFTLYRR